MKLNKYWFRPKIYGYGAYPTTWEGWLFIVLIMVIFLIFLDLYTTTKSIIYAYFSGFILVFLAYGSKLKTKEEWKWRWGK